MEKDGCPRASGQGENEVCLPKEADEYKMSK